jgi:hypothetical protein
MSRKGRVMPTHKTGLRLPWRAVWPLAALAFTLMGCVSSSGARYWPSASVAPKQVIETGNYKAFLVENEQQLQRCGGWTDCDVPLFNLVFLHTYPDSPYRNALRARQYGDELRKRYPQSPWAAQGQVLIAFMNECSSLEEAQRRLRVELRTREATIRKLRGQLDRSREIDVEIQKRERELLR